MDRLHRKKRSFGQDNLDYWYLTPTLSSKDLVCAYKFIGAENEETALKNINREDVEYFLTKKTAGIHWSAEEGIRLGSDDEDDPNRLYQGLHCEKLRNTNIKSAVIRFDAPEADVSATGMSATANGQPIAQPTGSFGIGRCLGYISTTPRFSRGFGMSFDTASAGYMAGGLGAFFGGGSSLSQGFWSESAGEFVVVGSRGSSKAHFTCSKERDQDKLFVFEETTIAPNIVYGGYSYTFATNHKYFKLTIKAAAFYNRDLTEQEHRDLLRTTWAIR